MKKNNPLIFILTYVGAFVMLNFVVFKNYPSINSAVLEVNKVLNFNTYTFIFFLVLFMIPMSLLIFYCLKFLIIITTNLFIDIDDKLNLDITISLALSNTLCNVFTALIINLFPIKYIVLTTITPVCISLLFFYFIFSENNKMKEAIIPSISYSLIMLVNYIYVLIK